MDDKRTIMLVEDNPDDEQLILRSLKKIGIGNEVVVARDGQQAVDYLLGEKDPGSPGGPGLPVVVLLDLHLPKLDGLDVLQRIRASKRTELLPVVVLTSSDEEKDRLDSYRLGTNSYVCKPVDFLEFAEAVRKLGLYWVLLNKGPGG